MSSTPKSPVRPPQRHRLDVVALVSGVLFTAVAGGLLWSAYGTVDLDLIKIGAPLLLVVVGVVGLALSRNRS